MFRRVMAGGAGLVLAASLAGCSAAPADDGTITLTFEALAWQSTSIDANLAIIEEWNSQNPDVQVEYVQGDWGSIRDELTTAFEGGKGPDLFHYYDTGLQPFAERGDVLDLTEYLSSDFVASVREEAWVNVSFRGLEGIWGVPFLQEPILIYGNKALFDAAGVPVPTTDDPWTWDEYQAAARDLTSDGVYGAVMPLMNRTDLIVGLGQSFGAEYFTEDGTALQWGEAESEVPTRVHSMLYEDKTMPLEVLGLGPEDVVPGFLAGDFATVFGGSYLRQQFEEGKGEGFEWVAIPPPVGIDQNTPNGAQTISVSAQTEHPEEAVRFLEFMLNGENQAALAVGDWLTPTSIDAVDAPEFQDAAGGWPVAIAQSENLVQAVYQQVPGWDEWVDRAGNGAFAAYFANEVTLDELITRLEAEGNPVLERAAERR